MKKPNSVEEFTQLIYGMVHRERFVFSTKYGGRVEIYQTIKFEAQGAPENICSTVYDHNGNKISSSNKLLKLWSDSYFEQIYSHLA